MINEYPKISIVTVVFNAGKTIEQTINSIVNQTYENIEYIIIDGGSTDETINIIKKYEDRISYWVSEPDRGIYDGMNKGIDVATGAYIIFIHAGDLLREEILKKMHPYFIDDFCNFIYGNVFMKDINKIYNGKYNKYKLILSNICQQSIFYHREIFNMIGKHDLKYLVLADKVLNIKCFGEKKINKIYVNQIVSDYEGGGFSSNRDDLQFQLDRKIIIKENFGNVYFYIFIIRKVIVILLNVLGVKLILKKLLRV